MMLSHERVDRRLGPAIKKELDDSVDQEMMFYTEHESVEQRVLKMSTNHHNKSLAARNSESNFPSSSINSHKSVQNISFGSKPAIKARHQRTQSHHQISVPTIYGSKSKKSFHQKNASISTC